MRNSGGGRDGRARAATAMMGTEIHLWRGGRGTRAAGGGGMSLMMPLCFAMPDLMAINSTVFAVLSFMEWNGLHDLNDG